MTKKIIGLYQLITGVFGVILILFTALTEGKSLLQSQQAILGVVIGVLLFGLLTWAGYGLLNSVKNAKKYSLFLQAVQIFYVAIPGLQYKFTAAGFVSLGFKQGQLGIDFSMQPIHYELTSNPYGEQNFILFLIPVIMLIALIKDK